ncbi:enoyl-CoA hydratase [Spongiibacter sp. KMU-166]|uniref:Enoyl-CoA hydratase n=1 Tax=Spongiibacter thalassae TaxID=2721624 RepID=A0ABX1GDD8_9GAMM|nr:enoyl-CoA hydratase [Spongiibacter thalassae]NKI16598.1 enoyl-CoA hydratase [Spongiibacter thalassae]
MDQTTMDQALVLQHLENGVLTLTLNRPAKLNALNPPMMRQLTDAMADAAANRDARVVVITGAGKAFCAGGDIAGKPEKKQPMSAEEEAAAAERRAKRPPDTIVNRVKWLRDNMETSRILYEMPKPTIAMIRGATVSVGMALAGACDFRVASNKAVFITSFIKAGLSGDYGASFFLTRLLGSAKAKELMYLSEKVSAEEALRIGLINQLVDDSELETATMTLAARLAKAPPITLELMKRNMNAAVDASLSDQLDREASHMVMSSMTDDHKEAIRAFAEKREPVFSGK